MSVKQTNPVHECLITRKAATSRSSPATPIDLSRAIWLAAWRRSGHILESFISCREALESCRPFFAGGGPACRLLRLGRQPEGAGQGLLVYPGPPTPLPTSCSASARPLPNNSPALSYRGSPRTSACSPVRCRNLHDNASRARTRERTSTRSAI